MLTKISKLFLLVIVICYSTESQSDDSKMNIKCKNKKNSIFVKQTWDSDRKIKTKTW